MTFTFAELDNHEQYHENGLYNRYNSISDRNKTHRLNKKIRNIFPRGYIKRMHRAVKEQ